MKTKKQRAAAAEAAYPSRVYPKNGPAEALGRHVAYLAALMDRNVRKLEANAVALQRATSVFRTALRGKVFENPQAAAAWLDGRRRALDGERPVLVRRIIRQAMAIQHVERARRRRAEREQLDTGGQG
jgi:hypothetical protein